MNKATTLIRKHLEQYNPGSAESFFLAHGLEMPWRQFPSELQGGEKKYCYENAYRLAMRSGLIYCEGMVLRNFPIPLSHAWCLDGEGFVVDPTLPDPEPGEIRTYFGVAFPLPFVTNLREQIGQACISDDGGGRCPVATKYGNGDILLS